MRIARPDLTTTFTSPVSGLTYTRGMQVAEDYVTASGHPEHFVDRHTPDGDAAEAEAAAAVTA